jgi:hypothetical protein
MVGPSAIGSEKGTPTSIISTPLFSKSLKISKEVFRSGKPAEKNHGRAPLSVYKLPPEVYLCGERFPLEDRNVWENLDRELLVALSNDGQVLLWMKRARRYFPFIEKRLKEMSKQELAQAAFFEGASFMWHFMQRMSQEQQAAGSQKAEPDTGNKK